MSKCYFCGEETKGRKFVGKNFLTREREKFDICENCCVTDLEDEDQMGLSGGHEEYLAEAREWLEHIKNTRG